MTVRSENELASCQTFILRGVYSSGLCCLIHMKIPLEESSKLHDRIRIRSRYVARNVRGKGSRISPAPIPPHEGSCSLIVVRLRCAVTKEGNEVVSHCRPGELIFGIAFLARDDKSVDPFLLEQGFEKDDVGEVCAN